MKAVLKRELLPSTSQFQKIKIIERRLTQIKKIKQLLLRATKIEI
jgi:hypothetical protein